MSKEHKPFGQKTKMSKDHQPFVPKTPTDFQKLKLERLMQHPEKPVIIPESPREKKGFSVPEFVRNVMGSSAGAGSGEFHVYRHLRRKEYTRQKMIEEKGEKEKLDDEYRQKLEDNKRKMEEKTAKNRAKRLKRKEKLKNKAKSTGQFGIASKDAKAESSSEEEDSENNEDLCEESQENKEDLCEESQENKEKTVSGFDCSNDTIDSNENSREDADNSHCADAVSEETTKTSDSLS